MKKITLILLLITPCFCYCQTDRGSFLYHPYQTNSWVFDLSGSLYWGIGKNSSEFNHFYRFQIQHFISRHVKMFGNNCLALDFNFSFFDNKIMQVSLGNIAAVATWAGNIPYRVACNRMADDLEYEWKRENIQFDDFDLMFEAQFGDNGYLDGIVMSRMMTLFALAALSSASIHFPFGYAGGYCGMFINWDLLKYNFDVTNIKDKSNRFLSGNCGLGLHISPLYDNQLIIKVFSTYDWEYKSKENKEEIRRYNGFTLGLSVAYNLITYKNSKSQKY